MINIIGDSHAFRLTDCTQARVFFLPEATTAFNLDRQTDKIREAIAPYPTERWYFWFGEVDCRIHIHLKKVQYELPNYSDLIRATVNRYVRHIKSFHSNVGVFAIPPAGFEKNIYNVEHYADRKTRQEIVYQFNSNLEVVSIRAGLKFIDFLPEFNHTGLVDMVNFEDPAHLKKEIILQGFEQWLQLEE